MTEQYDNKISDLNEIIKQKESDFENLVYKINQISIGIKSLNNEIHYDIKEGFDNDKI